MAGAIAGLVQERIPCPSLSPTLLKGQVQDIVMILFTSLGLASASRNVCLLLFQAKSITTQYIN